MTVQNHLRKCALVCALFGTILALFSIGAHALTVSHVLVDDALSDAGMNETLKIMIQNNTAATMQFRPPAGAYDVVVNGDPALLVNGSVAIPTRCVACNVTIGYRLPDAVRAEGNGKNSFSRTLDLPVRPQELVYAVRLRPGDAIAVQDADPSVVPSPSKVLTDGERIIVLWSQKSPALPQRYFVRFIGYETRDTASVTISQEFTEWAAWALIVAALAVGIALGIAAERFLLLRNPGNVSSFVPASLLSPDERTIIGVLSKRHEPVGQKELGKEMHWSKSKVSAIMTGLERKGIVSREKIGRNYRIVLVKGVAEKE